MSSMTGMPVRRSEDLTETTPDDTRQRLPYLTKLKQGWPVRCHHRLEKTCDAKKTSGDQRPRNPRVLILGVYCSA